MIFFANPSPSRGGAAATPLPPNFWNDPPGRKLLPQFCSIYSYRRVNWRYVFKALNAKTLKEKNKSGGGGVQLILCLVNSIFLKTKRWVFITLFEIRFFTNIQTLKLGFQSNYHHRQAFLLGVLSAMLELTVGSTSSRGRAQSTCADRLDTKTKTTAET